MTCAVESCQRESVARGMCDMHYHRVWRAQMPEEQKRRYSEAQRLGRLRRRSPLAKAISRLNDDGTTKP